MESDKKIYFYPKWLRIWHGINAIGIILLIFSGISMNSGVENNFIGFNAIVNIHNYAGVIVSINYLLFLLGNLFTNNKKSYIVKPKGFLKRPMKQAYYYAWGMFHGMKAPYPLSEKRKFNPLQKYSYIIVMYMAVPLVIVSGFALLYPETIIDRVYNISGVFLTAILHSAMGFFISIFLIIHLYVASIGKNPIENFKSIVSGWHHV
ncbi:cytochrome b/b6 domain-containing protein [Maribellus maritimus]|uniref:cytochrome b/b6 domain-containing protein n=1 Tax=Maribellus maritimus TaxID=2870838 RepID=UPI001EEBC9AA|nr:cytochrome b/b6 domain-containing protein [Maribellus maritimus]MCG6189253.1 cytochrome b/b6 domain-containing protein [Maribellus maritimus]